MADVPDALKSSKPYFVLYKQFIKRDPVVSYYVLMYAVQESLKLSKKEPEVKQFLLQKMDLLEQLKRSLEGDDKEAIQSEIVGQSHVEGAGLKLFEYADTEDRAGKFSKAVIKSFYTASQILTTLKQFGELSEDVEQKMTYAKWKAVEIDRCLKNGITPTPGPPGNLEQDLQPGPSEPYPPGPGPSGGVAGPYPPGPSGSQDFQPYPPVPSGGQDFQPYPPVPSGGQDFQPYPPGPSGGQDFQPYPPGPSGDKPVPKPRHNFHQNDTSNTPPTMGVASSSSSLDPTTMPPTTGVAIGPAEITKANKLCKFGMSCLDYEDVPGAIDYLTKAIYLLKTGKEQN